MASAGLTAPAASNRHEHSGMARADQRIFVLTLALLLATIAVYLPVHYHPFFNVDDGLYVLHNEHVREGLSWETVKWSFTAFDRSNWVPLTFLSHALDYQLFGEQPAGHHDVNIIFQALNAVLLFWVLAAATGSVNRSFMVAALFALHPVNVEAVAWIAERKTLLSMFFFLLALGAYRRYTRQPRVGRYLVIVLLFALGLCAKAQIITLPFVLLLWDYWPLERILPQQPQNSSATVRTPAKSLSWLIMEKLPLLAIGVLSAIFTLYSEHDARPHLWLPLSERLGNAIFSYATYIQKTFWPSGLAPLYPNRGASLSPWQIAADALFLLALTGWVIVARRHRYLPVGWFWFLGTLVPMLQIVQFGKEGMGDRFAYQALIGLFIMLCWGIADVAERRQLSPVWLTAASLIVLMALAVTARHQVNFWKDDLTMWQHAAATVKGHWEAEDNIGVALLRSGRPEDEVMPHFARAAQMNPADPVSNMHVAVFDQKTGQLREAIAHYENVLSTPSPAVIRAQIYQNMGLAYTDLGDPAKAQQCFNQAADLRTQ